MRPNPIPLIAAIVCLSFSLHAQDSTRFSLRLNAGSFIPASNISKDLLNELNQKALRIDGKALFVIQFEEIPNEQQRMQLKQSGVELLDYITGNAYTATITNLPDAAFLLSEKIRSVVELMPAQKMHPQLVSGNYPAHAVKAYGTVDVWLSFPRSFSYETVKSELENRGIIINHNAYKDFNVMGVRVNVQQLRDLAALPIVEYMEPAPHEPVELNNKSIANSRANILQSSLTGGRNLKGNGVTIGVGDNANPLNHGDFSGRLINRAAIPGNNHGLHVTGTAAGAGILNERFVGYAPKATIIKQLFSNILTYAPAYIQDFGMVITNNSYGNIVNDCATFGQYTLYSRVMDLQQLQYPSLQHLFAAGNSATLTCSPYPTGFNTVLGDYQSAKNVITVGSTTDLGLLSGFSSRGPVKDGRIKPEIMAQGSAVISCWGFNIYTSTSGTSMASPGVSGGLALMYQRYRQLHSGNNPKNALVKALLCNGAEDKGNTGPDYSYGFGWMNLNRSVDMLENNRYYTNSIAHAATQTQTITVPSNTSLLKVMLYWNDPAASVLAAPALVNDLDLEVDDPLSITQLPLILDTVPANVNNNAFAGVDHINNIEQVVINNPVAGTYTIRVKGTSVTQSPPQEYFVVYDFVPNSTVLTFPIGGEKLMPGEVVNINWEDNDAIASTFTLEYSTNGGSSWILLDNAVAAASRQYTWTVPSVVTHQARVRLTRNNNSAQSTSQDFVIIGAPTVSLSAIQCEDYISVDWTTVTGATDYEVMKLQGDEMVSVAIVNSPPPYILSGLSKDTLYYVTVRARINGNPGIRPQAVWRQPNNGNCAGSISDNDLKLDSLFSPEVSGRLLTSTAFSNAVPITIKIKNLDDAATTGDINVSYSINGGPAVLETITDPQIPAGGSLIYTFSTAADLSATGTYTINVSISPQTADPVPQNNSLTRTVKQLNNPVIDLTSPFLDDMESAPEFTYYNRQVGFSGLDRYDFKTATIYGRVRSFINTGIAYSGSKALTLDADRYNAGGTTDSLTGTFNLSSYNAVTHDIRLDFRYKNHGQVSNAANKVWIRGDDQQNWIQIYDLHANQNPADGSYKLTSSIEIADSLAAHGQDFSSSFQIRWGQWGQILAAGDDGGAGYSFDDVRLYLVTDDIHLVSIDTPVVNNCNLSAATPVRITVRNTSNNTVTNVPVRYRINGGAYIPDEFIASIAANSTVQYAFTTTADLSAPGNQLVEAEVDYPTDTFHDNDTLSVNLVNSPVITVTSANPYLQDFESGTASWYTGGKASSWEYGTPASVKIKRAASGTKAWKTTLKGNYNDHENSYLYSPCFDFSSLSKPTLSLSIALDLEDCGSVFCDGAWIEYSTDGYTWTRLGANGEGTNWYNKAYSGNNLWSVHNYQRWHVATTSLSAIPAAQRSQVRLRFVLSSDPGVNREGIAVDDIHIYDNTDSIYNGATMGAPVTQTINGGEGWVHFTESGKLVASVMSPVAMGSTDVQAYIHTGAVRTNSGQYYHNRNITIKPATVNLTDSATVRFYFTDTETEALIAATGCGGCYKPAMAYELGISKYSDPNDFYEDGVVENGQFPGGWSFIHNSKIRFVPFDVGYYAEYKVKDFSEFWLNNGGIDNNHPLPVQLLSFSVRKQTGDEVLAEWKTAQELDVNRYEVQLARGAEDLQSNRFTTIGQVNSLGNTASERQYSFTDRELNKTGVRYYRLKIVDNDGSYSYSPVRPVVFSQETDWRVFPNPSAGLFGLLLQAAADEAMHLRVYDAAGRLVQQQQRVATGFVQKLFIDLQDKHFAPGLYLLEVTAGDKRQSFRVLKQ